MGMKKYSFKQILSLSYTRHFLHVQVIYLEKGSSSIMSATVSKNQVVTNPIPS